jgi:hypothetical protein
MVARSSRARQEREFPVTLTTGGYLTSVQIIVFAGVETVTVKLAV